MDGIDGITPSVTITLILGVLVIRSLELYPTNWIFEFGIIFSCLAFLFWNWHPAKIFLGDVGSISLGFACGTLLLTPIIYGKWEVISLIMYYVLDTSLTLINRFMAGKKVWQAHSEHYYQKAVRSGMSQSQVVSLIITLQALIIATCYFIENPYLVVFLAFLESAGLIIYFSSKYKKST
jgi:UDP-N-acetylmuramyl pentapeptide phosphotransferase/UDP-N-acetylglucosamine-1-phosphate transferase